MTATLQWGDVAEWVAGLATVAAVWVAAISVVKANKATREARESLAWSEAHLVSTMASGDRPNVGIDVVNRGSRAVFDVDVVVTSPLTGAHVGGNHWPTVPPGRKQRRWEFGLTEQWGWADAHSPIVDVEATFTDVGQRRWKVLDDGTLTSFGEGRPVMVRP